MEAKDSMGNLNQQTFDEIWNSEKAKAVRGRVACCQRGCWMVGSAVPAMRKNIARAATWVLKNKVNATLGRELALK